MKESIYYLISILIILLSSCTRPLPESNRPNIVWITSEDNSKHYLKLFDDNGVRTPNIEKLAADGIVFRHAFSNAPVCSVARSTLITGCYAPRVGAQFHRKIKIVPMPDSLKMFPTYLRRAGYYTTNNSKEDYNLIKGDSVWDESSRNASWRNRATDQPFFHVFNIGISHESSLHFTEEDMQQTKPTTDLQSFKVHPNHPDTELFRYTNAYYRDKIREMDKKVGDVVDELEKDGLLENTFIFYFGDHGGVLPGSKGYLFETGLHVPLVIYIPEKYRHQLDLQPGSDQEGFVSFVDFAPTVLNLAGINVPQEMDGRAFLGPGISNQEVSQRNITYSYADRFDEKYDQVRAIRKGRYKYIRYFQPFNIDGLMNNYRYRQLAYQEWLTMHQEHKLDTVQAAFFIHHPVEALYDLQNDPYETDNLATKAPQHDHLTEMRQLLNAWLIEMPDLSLYPEHFLIENAFENPTGFGNSHQPQIKRYLDVANLALKTSDTESGTLLNLLKSEDLWDRYWALNVSISLKVKTETLHMEIKNITQNDGELINRVRGAEYLAIAYSQNPVNLMTGCLYESTQPAEALLIFNAMTLMQDGYDYNFKLNIKEMHPNVRENDEVKRRIEYFE
ncbi:MAG: sulfatase [Saprospiraceae bacterium]|nr:sulfatase [Saprospiraceae bacterium]